MKALESLFIEQKLKRIDEILSKYGSNSKSTDSNTKSSTGEKQHRFYSSDTRQNDNFGKYKTSNLKLSNGLAADADYDSPNKYNARPAYAGCDMGRKV